MNIRLTSIALGAALVASAAITTKEKGSEKGSGRNGT